ncbi:MAG: HlyC/CorC family transporter [Syntrophobacterales bacterium]|nr:HlyC/CorC family transporter [Syntrophobacterales bacterium]
MGIRDLLKAAVKKEPERLEREIQEIIAEGEAAGIIDHYSGQMIRNILEFRETVVREIMKPRTEIVALPVEATIHEILELMSNHGYTRMPVYRETLDNIVGILNVKDLFKMWSQEVGSDEILTILRKPYYVPETKNINSLFHELKAERRQMAIIIDEYGGTAGLVTIEDLIEEIVGEIVGEHEPEERKIVEMTDGTFLVDGRAEIEEVEACFGVEIPKGKYETLGGFILHLIRKIPASGEKVSYGCLEMAVESADEKRIKKVRVRRTAEKEKSEEAARPEIST